MWYIADNRDGETAEWYRFKLGKQTWSRQVPANRRVVLRRDAGKGVKASIWLGKHATKVIGDDRRKDTRTPTRTCGPSGSG